VTGNQSINIHGILPDSSSAYAKLHALPRDVNEGQGQGHINEAKAEAKPKI